MNLFSIFGIFLIVSGVALLVAADLRLRQRKSLPTVEIRLRSSRDLVLRLSREIPH